MKIKTLSLACFWLMVSVLFSNSIWSQNNNLYVPRPIQLKTASAEVGIFIGGSYYIGDLNPSGHFNQFTRPAGGLLYRHNFTPRWAAKAIFSAGTIAGDDTYSKSDALRNRNLSFKSNIFEFAVEEEFNFLPYTTGNKKLSSVAPYIFGGVAVFHFNPKAQFEGHWYDLQELGTEGQGSSFVKKKRYSLTQFSIPFGVGIKLNTANRLGLTLEWGLRMTFTDYLDDVGGKYIDTRLLLAESGDAAAFFADRSLKRDASGSNVGKQRGNSNSNDWYSFVGIFITYKLGGRPHCDVPH